MNKKMEGMEEVIHLIYQGSKLAKDMESSLPNLANHPEMLSKSCDEIIMVFGTARDRLNALQAARATSYSQLLPQQRQQLDPSLHEWLKSGYTQAMDLIQRQINVAAAKTSTELFRGEGSSSSSSSQLLFRATELGDQLHHQPIDALLDSGTCRPTSSAQRPARRRKDDAEKRTVTIPAPQHGNTELPPEDGFTWRKYGQKEILGSRFPRAYYRCTHQKLYQCPAKKQVQRLDNDPYMFEITYRGVHTCHMSSTAPSMAPPPPEFTQAMSQTTNTTTIATHHQPSPPATTLGQWLSIDCRGVGGTSASSSSTMARPAADGSGSSRDGGAGPSSVRYGKEGDSVADLADVMFNSGSSSTNSMDFIFHSVEDKWDSENNKKK